MKSATGPYDRAKLLDYLTEQGKNEKDWEHYKSYVPGEKKGKVWQAPPVAKPTSAEEDEFMVNTEWDDVLANASESEIVELAGAFASPSTSAERTFCLFSYFGFHWSDQSSSIPCCAD